MWRRDGEGDEGCAVPSFRQERSGQERFERLVREGEAIAIGAANALGSGGETVGTLAPESRRPRNSESSADPWTRVHPLRFSTSLLGFCFPFQ